MEFEHVPVLFDEVMEALDIKPDGIYVDGTVGGGGHSEGICRRLAEGGMLIAVDRDREALAAAERRLAGYGCGKKFVHANYSDTEAIAAAAGVPTVPASKMPMEPAVVAPKSIVAPLAPSPKNVTSR